MPLSNHKLLSLLFIFGITACSDTGATNKTEAHVTNAESVLNSLETENATAIAFHVKPNNAATCKTMYIEFGKKDAEGKWPSILSSNPGKDKNENFGQFQLSNQIHFLEIEAGGEFGVTALGCKPHNKRPIMIEGLFATFEVTPEKLNYIGEIALIPSGESQGQSLFRVNVTDRGDFALNQIRTQLPRLETYFQFNTMEKYVEELPPELLANLKELDEVVRNTTEKTHKIKAARNQLIDEVAMAHLEFEIWKDENGHDRRRLTEAQRVTYEQLDNDLMWARSKIYLFDLWVRHGKSYTEIQNFMTLVTDENHARKIYDTKFPSKSFSELSESELNDPERIRLSEALTKARDARSAYEKIHGLE